MATRRFGLPRLPDHPGHALVETFRHLLAWRPDDPRQLLWRIFWFPFWIGGDVPAPWRPEHERRLKAGSPAAIGAARAIDSIGRRIWINWIIACLARGLWLPFAIGSAVGFIDLLRGAHFAPERLIWIWAITLPLGFLLGLLLRPCRRRVAWMLDHTFHLHDRMTTAVEALETEAPAPGSRASMAYLQLADTANAAIGLRGDPRFRLHPPAREISLAILFGLLLAAMLFLRGVGGHIPDPAETAVPQFVPAADRQTAADAPNDNPGQTERPLTVKEVQQKSDKSNATREDLNAIADALDQNAITQPAAEAIRNGDYATAAQEIRDAAGQASKLSPEARSELADALDQAAASAQDPSLSNAASQAADGLRQGGQTAESSMRDLGDAVDLAADSVVEQSELSAQMQQAQQAAQNQQSGADASPNQQPGGARNSSNQSSRQAAQSGQQAPSDSGGASDPSGADASSGLSDEQQAQGSQQNDQSSDSQSAQGANSNTQGGQQPGSEAGDQGKGGQKSDDAQSGQGESGGEGQSADGDVPSVSRSQTQSGGEATGGKPGGSGVGGESQTPPAGGDEQDSAGGANNKESTPKETPAPTNVSEATQPAVAGAGPTAIPTASVNLQDQSSGGETISLGGNNGSSSLGGGGGVTEAEGSATQAAVPTAGPDSNRVPPEYRSVVENYFNRGTP